MRLFRRIKRFANLPADLRQSFFEAVIVSGMVKFSLLFLPFSKVVRWLGEFNTLPSDTAELSEKSRANVSTIIQAINLCHYCTPWRTECYTTALTAKILLKKKDIKSTLYIGFRKDRPGSFEGHAWLICKNIVVTGECDFSQFQVHTFFS